MGKLRTVTMVATATGTSVATGTPADVSQRNLDMRHMLGAVSTAMESPAHGDADAHTDTKLGDPQWVRDTPPDLERRRVSTGRASPASMDIVFLGKYSEMAAHCAESREKHQECHSLLRQSEPSIGNGRAVLFKSSASSTGLSMGLFERCIGHQECERRASCDTRQGQAGGATVVLALFIAVLEGLVRPVWAQRASAFRQAMDSLI